MGLYSPPMAVSEQGLPPCCVVPMAAALPSFHSLSYHCDNQELGSQDLHLQYALEASSHLFMTSAPPPPDLRRHCRDSTGSP